MTTISTPYAPPADTGLEALHVDGDLLVLVKPSGLLSVPGRGLEKQDCLETRAAARWTGARIVHRLDMETSGVMVMARNADTHRHLSMQFEAGNTRKTYVARVFGQIKDDAGEINLPLMKDWPNRPLQKVDHESGKPSKTLWDAIAREANATSVRLTPLTGRTHQLRVHMATIGHPILGDTLYASGEALSAAPRLQLHAETLGFTHPVTGEAMEFEAACEF